MIVFTTMRSNIIAWLEKVAPDNVFSHTLAHTTQAGRGLNYARDSEDENQGVLADFLACQET